MPRIHIVTNTGELVDTLDVDKTWDIDSPIHIMSIKDWVSDTLHTARNIEEKQS